MIPIAGVKVSVPLIVLWIMTLCDSLVECGKFTAIIGCVVLHEYGHWWAAKKCGLKPSDMRFQLFFASVTVESPIGVKEVFVSLAGPAMNVLLAIAFLPLAFSDNYVLWWIWWSNAMLCICNLIPAFPLDGGKTFRSLVALLIGDNRKATYLTSRLGECFAVSFVIVFVLANMHPLYVIAMSLMATVALIASYAERHRDEIKSQRKRDKQGFYKMEISRHGKVNYVHYIEPSPGIQIKEECMLYTHRDCPSQHRAFWRLYWIGKADSEDDALVLAQQTRIMILRGECPPGVDMGRNVPEVQTEGEA